MSQKNYAGVLTNTANRMDASAYLKRHGWRGDGHSLDLTDRGIRRPLLISKKIDVLGLGVNKHAAVSDQWWMRAFDQGLKDLGTGKQGALASVRKHGMHHGGLYGRFVKGESVPGTIGKKGWVSYIAAEEHRTDRPETHEGNDTSLEDGCSKNKRDGDGGRTEKPDRRKKQKTKSQLKQAVGVNEIVDAAQACPRQLTAEVLHKEPRKRKLSMAKLATYEKRAECKGITVDEYIKRREKKYAARKGTRLKPPP